MFDPITNKEIVRFLVPTALGCLAYVLATLAAHLITSNPHRIYIGRLVFFVVLLLLIAPFYLPFAAVTFSGTREHYYEIGGEARGMGTHYGMKTGWIWFCLALSKWPRKNRTDQAA
jgi:hypothetical protein